MSLKVVSILVLAAMASPAFAEAPIKPGYWESTNVASLIGPGTPKTERRCITADKVDEYLSGPSTSHYHCTYSRKSIAGGVADFKGQCVDKHGTAFNVALHGTYSGEAFHMDATLSLPNLPINGSATTDAHRISATCPADGDAK
jgi:hypothetical protein